ncbi:unnamed protein product [Rhizoctonia solani]|uniref:Uncharacterized protein n=1 Tax=Rhizoctonia solani TaxID=456999 RepID=A0A8H3H0S3_9AGAM|nr:unnamed protein product [Rhizoctonia solani]
MGATHYPSSLLLIFSLHLFDTVSITIAAGRRTFDILSIYIIMPYVLSSTHLYTFTFDGTDLLYANFPRVPVKDLRHLLARGSGYVVRGQRMPKLWFQAQCAHYGLPTNGTLAALRNQLDTFLAKPLPQIPRSLFILEKQKRDEHALATFPMLLQEELPMGQLQDERNEQTDDCVPSGTTNGGSCPPTQHPVLTQAIQPLADKTNLSSTSVAPPPKKLSLPWAKVAAVAKFKKSVRWDPVLAENALQEIKLRMGRPEPTSGTDTESDSEDDSPRSSRFGVFAPRASRYSSTRWPPRNLVPFTADVVSGRWELRVTCHNMAPLPAPWRAVSSKWLKGDMNVQLAGDGQSLAGEFALLGLDGKFKSRKCDLRANGIGAWVRFVAQMPIATTKPLRGQGHKEYGLTFGPSETQYGYLRFYGGNKVGGMLRCREYGRLEFTGTRVDGPTSMTSKWSNFIE